MAVVILHFILINLIDIIISRFSVRIINDKFFLNDSGINIKKMQIIFVI
jgi:hypothetical protein